MGRVTAREHRQERHQKQQREPEHGGVEFTGPLWILSFLRTAPIAFFAAPVAWLTREGHAASLRPTTSHSGWGWRRPKTRAKPSCHRGTSPDMTSESIMWVASFLVGAAIGSVIWKLRRPEGK